MAFNFNSLNEIEQELTAIDEMEFTEDIEPDYDIPTNEPDYEDNEVLTEKNTDAVNHNNNMDIDLDFNRQAPERTPSESNDDNSVSKESQDVNEEFENLKIPAYDNAKPNNIHKDKSVEILEQITNSNKEKENDTLKKNTTTHHSNNNNQEQSGTPDILKNNSPSQSIIYDEEEIEKLARSFNQKKQEEQQIKEKSEEHSSTNETIIDNRKIPSTTESSPSAPNKEETYADENISVPVETKNDEPKQEIFNHKVVESSTTTVASTPAPENKNISMNSYNNIPSNVSNTNNNEINYKNNQLLDENKNSSKKSFFKTQNNKADNKDDVMLKNEKAKELITKVIGFVVLVGVIIVIPLLMNGENGKKDDKKSNTVATTTEFYLEINNTDTAEPIQIEGSSRFETLEDLTLYISSNQGVILSNEKQAVTKYNNGVLSKEDTLAILNANIDASNQLYQLLILNKSAYENEGKLDEYDNLYTNMENVLSYGINEKSKIQ